MHLVGVSRGTGDIPWTECCPGDGAVDAIGMDRGPRAGQIPRQPNSVAAVLSRIDTSCHSVQLSM